MGENYNGVENIAKKGIFMSDLKYLSTILINSIIKIVFYMSCIFPVRKNKISFASYRNDELKGNLLYINNEIKNQNLNFVCKYLTNKYKAGLLGKIFYMLQMLRSTYHIATSKYFFIDDYYYPVYVIKPRKGTVIIQVWHAAGAFKKFGHSTIGKKFGPSKNYLKHVKVHSNYTYAVVSSNEVIPHYAEAFNIQRNKILPLGMPRMDFFFESKHKKVIDRFYEIYSELKQKKIILYAPTYRGDSFNQVKFTSLVNFNKLHDMIGENYVILVHLHPYVKSEFDIENMNLETFIYEPTNEFNLEELMLVSDLMITDYSSVIFDYSVLLKPIIFYTPDLEEYTEERDFYYDFKTFIPGPFFKDTKTMAEYIIKEEFDLSKMKTFRNKFFNYLDDKNAERVVNSILHEKDE